uniref:Ig-like domain-containing protein n=1 Tax=Scleropages formosus TaxID=113540 RepID=A0A8C9SSZ8_SCLFO
MFWFRQRPGENIELIVFTSVGLEACSFFIFDVHSQIFFVSAGDTRGNDVTQTPTILFVPKGTNAEMNCSHNKGAAYFQMYWYQQLPGENIHSIEDPFTEHFNISGNGASWASLHISSVRAEDSAVFFCAVSQHSGEDAVSLPQLHKTTKACFEDTDSEGAAGLSETELITCKWAAISFPTNISEGHCEIRIPKKCNLSCVEESVVQRINWLSVVMRDFMGGGSPSYTFL